MKKSELQQIIREEVEKVLNESNRFGIDYDNKASKYVGVNYATNPQKPKRVIPFGYNEDSKELKKYGLDSKSAALLTKYFNQGLRVIYDFVNKEDFSKYKNTGERDSDHSTNFEDRAFIFYTLTSHLGGYSQNALKYGDFLYIGIKGNLDGYTIINHRWAGRYSVGATEDFPENRPQLTLRREVDKSQILREIYKEIPEAITYIEKHIHTWI